LRVAIVDDEPLGRERLRTLLAAETGVALVAEFGSGPEAIRGLTMVLPEVLFLDVQMPGLDGIAVVRELETRIPPAHLPVIVFVTAHDRYALDAFEVSATDYLLKPFDRPRFQAALQRARARVVERDATRIGTRFVVRTAGKVLLVDAAEVEYITGEGNYVRLHVGSRTYLVRETIKSVETRLDPRRFMRVHRSAIVRIDCVRTLQPHAHGEYVVTMRDGARLTSSRSYSTRVREMLRHRSGTAAVM
jgi:two-component system, LytTR family, response regulator